MEVTALWVRQCTGIAYIGWAFGSYHTDCIIAGDRPNKVTVNWGSTVPYGPGTFVFDKYTLFQKILLWMEMVIMEMAW